MISMQQSIDAYGSFHILSFENSLLILYLMEIYVFNFNVHQTIATTYENCLHYFVLLPSSLNP